MRTLAGICAAVCTLVPSSFASAAPTPAGPFTMNGWQFHDYNVPKLEEAIRRAPAYGVNFVIFSHELFRSVEGFLASDDDADPRHPPPEVKGLLTGENFRIV